MVIKNTFKALLVLFLLPVITLAQSNFKTGYVVTLKGDTLRGFIDYREWGVNPSEIRFKSEATATTVEHYTIQNATAFGVTGLETYQRFNVSVSTDRISINDPELGIDTIKHPKTVFLRCLIKGDNVNLYSYTDNIRARYYFSETGGTPAELNYWVYKVNDDKGTNLRYNRRYRLQLTYLAKQYKPNELNISRGIEGAEYLESELVKIVKQINNTLTTQPANFNNSGIVFFIGAGVNYGNIKFKGSVFEFAVNPNTTVTHTPTPFITAGFNYYINKATRKLYFVLDLTLMTDQHKLHATGFASSNTVTRDITLDYHQYSAVLTPQVAFNFYNTRRLKVFANLGAAVNYSTYNDYNYIEIYSGGFQSSTINKFPKFEKLWIAPTIKAGVTINQRFDVYAGTGISSSITNYQGYSGSVSSYQLGFHYFLGK